MRLRRTIAGIEDGDIFTDPKFLLIFLPAYMVSFAWIFLIPADFWDDLAIKNNPDLVAMGYHASLPTMGWVTAGLLKLPHPNFTGRSLIFLMFACVPFLVRRFIAYRALAPERERNAIAMLTALLPLFLSRFQLVTFYYCLSLLLFCFGSLLLAKTLSGRPSLVYRITAYICFTLAFFTQSFLVLYGFVLFLIILHLSHGAPSGRTWDRLSSGAADLARRSPDALLLPLVFFFMKAWLMPPIGPFVGYNAVTLQGILHALSILPVAAIMAVVDMTGLAPTWTLPGLLLLLGGLLLARPGGLTRSENISDAQPSTDAAALLIAFFGLMLAVFPYVTVHRAVLPYDFDDRDQLTMILAAGAVVVCAARTFLRSRVQWLTIFAVLIWAVATDISTYLDIIVDGHIQNAVVRSLSQNRDVRQNKAFLVDDSQWPFLSRGRRLSTAQLNCLMKAAFGDETRFAAELSSKPFDWKDQLTLLGRFRETGTCFRAYEDRPPVLLTVAPGPLALTDRHIAKLTFDWIFRPERYSSDLDKLVSVSITTLPDGVLKPR